MNWREMIRFLFAASLYCFRLKEAKLSPPVNVLSQHSLESYLASAMSKTNRRNTPLSKRRARRLLAAPPDDDLVAALRKVLKEYRGARWLTINETAELAGVSVRTLQRKLAAEELSFSELVEQVRAELATEMLTNTDVPLNQIAKELGYSAMPNFSRAFHRWAGKTPSDFRRSR